MNGNLLLSLKQINNKDRSLSSTVFFSGSNGIVIYLFRVVKGLCVTRDLRKN